MISSKEKHLVHTTYLRYVLVFMVCLFFGACLAALVYFPIPEENRSAVDILVGSVSTLLGAVFTYYFGNSAGSNRKSADEQYVIVGEEDDEQT